MPFISDWSESRKNCLNLIISGNLYVIFFVFLEWIVKNTVGGCNFWAQSFRNFYVWFIAIDVITMAINYKKLLGKIYF